MTESVREKSEGLPENPEIEEVEEFFKNDRFAYNQAQCRIVEARKDHAVAEMVLDEKIHFNADGNVMGGAIFTLADYAFAAATMCGTAHSVSLTSTIEFLSASRGEKLIATCDADRSGRKVGFFTTDVTDDTGKLIARVVSTCFHVS